jgi:hypothetical protein
MSRRTRTICVGGIVTGCLALALIPLPGLLRGDGSPQAPAAAALIPERGLLRGNGSPQASAGAKLVVHEWGTFTSFAGSNGVELEFRPLIANDLPKFINSPSTPFGVSLSKNRYVALQRMETPVTYFYTDVPRVVNVRVDFPQGMLTEWYPVVKQFQAGTTSAQGAILGNAYLDWGAVRLTPPEQFANVRVGRSGAPAVPASLPAVGPNDPYGRARETDSAIVETLDANRGSHFEKFLFYRGLGNFDLPMTLVAQGNDRFEVTNGADEASGPLLLVCIENDRVRFARIDPVRPRSAIEIDLPGAESSVDHLAEAMVRELTAAGLYEKEAWAMVNTWRSSWFGENGTRLLYLVPGSLTEKLLPLTIEPAPTERVRVLVGRLETITPEDGWRLVDALGSSDRSETRTADAITAELSSLGRFAEPAIQFLIGQTADPPTRARLEAILAEIRSGKLAVRRD